jgi:hypothetical protein
MEMEPNFKLKSPEGFKEWAGWSIKIIGSPIAGACIAYIIVQDAEWTLAIRVLVGIFLAFPWSWLISKWLLAPIWNSLYKPVPDLPKGNGVIESNIYKKSSGEMYLKGLGFDILKYTKEHNSCKLSLVRMNKDELKLLSRDDSIVKINYKFIRYRDGYVNLSIYPHGPRWGYKWPAYEYEILPIEK